MNVDLSIIIVNWNSVEHLRKCLASIDADEQHPLMEIVVVDNASYDGSADLVRREFPQVLFIQSKENIGFGQANNLGVRHSNGQTLLFLNPDTEVRAAALKQLITQLWAAAKVGAVGARLLNSDGTLQTTCLQAFPTVRNQLMDTDYLKKAFPRWRAWGMRPLFSADPISDEVEMISGACLMMKREAFEQVGGFSPEYFIYGEDVDLCYKVKHSGWLLRYVRDAEIVHHGGQSAKSRSETGFSDVMIRRSIFQFLSKTKGQLYAREYLLAIGVSSLVRLAIVNLLRCFPSGHDRREKLRLTHNKWNRILRWTIGLEPWTENYQPVTATAKAGTQVEQSRP